MFSFHIAAKHWLKKTESIQEVHYFVSDKIKTNLCGSYTIVDKLKFVLWDPHTQNFRLTSPPIPSSGSLFSTVHITHPSGERATTEIVTCTMIVVLQIGI